MKFADMHTHSKFSFDGQYSPEEMVLSAIDKNLSAIALTEHYDFDVHGGNCQYYEERREQRKIVMAQLKEKYSGKIKVLYGIEIGQTYAAPEKARQLADGDCFDVVIGGAHDAPLGNDVYSIDYSSRKVCEDTLNAYYIEMERLLGCICYDIVAHIDFPLRLMGDFFDKPDLSAYKDKILPIVKKIAQNGLAFEVNTQGVRNWQGQPCPQKWALDYFRSCGGEMITIGSDAHYIDHVGCGIEQARQLILSAGFKYITHFENRKPVLTRIEA